MTHDFGRFVWFELMAADTERAAAFYGEVLGWKIQSVEMPGGMKYTMLMAGSVAVGGLTPPPKADIPPHWVSYVSVPDVDRAAKAVLEHGGQCLMDAFEVPTVGRMQPVTDPQGAAFFLFHNEKGDGPTPTGPGAFHWNELLSPEPEAAVDFYQRALGFTHETMQMPHGPYFVLKNGEAARGGIMQPPAPTAPAHWQQFVTVEDCDATLRRAEQHGGQVVSPAVQVPGVGRFALLQDPLGAVLGVITPASPQ